MRILIELARLLYLTTYPGYPRPFLAVAIFLISIVFVEAQTRTSVQSGNWGTASTWDCTCVPGASEDAVIASGHTVTLDANYTINNFTINSGGIFDYNGNTLTVTTSVTPFITVQTGSYTAGSTWLNGSAPGATDRVIIVKGHTATTPSSGMPDVQDLTIDAGAVLSTANNKDVTITSNLAVNGTLILNSGNANLIFSTASTTVSGSGTIDASSSTNGVLVQAGTTISSGSNLAFLGNVDLDVGVTLTNNGNMIVSGGDIVGGSVASQLTMGTNSDLEIDGALLTTGVLDASTNAGSNVEYNGSAAQTIKSPSSNTYTSLTISGAGTKTFPANALTFEGSLIVNAGTLDVSNQNITIEGSWTNNATISNLATVTFSNTSDQGVTTNATDFVNLTINKSSGTVTLNENIIVTGTLTLTQGNINTGSNSLQLGSGSEGTYSYTAGRIIGTFGRYIDNLTTSALEYPIGTSGNDRTVSVTFNGTGSGRADGVVFAEFVESDPGNSGLSLDDNGTTIYNTFNEGYWDFTVNGFALGGGSNSLDLVLTGDGFSSFTIGSGTRLLTRATSGNDWIADGSHNTVSGNDVSRTGITTFVAQFGFGDDTNCTGPSDPVITGSTDVCTSDTNDTYSVTLNSGNDYNFTVVGGTIDEAGGGTTTGFVTDQNSITVDWGSTGQVGSVSVVERNSCTSSNTITLNVNINSIPPASISGKTLVAENSTGIAYSVTNDANTTYTWTITGGTQASGGTTNSITVDWGSNGAGSVAVTATKTSPSCSASAQTVLNVTKYIVVDSDVNAAGCNGNWNDDDCWATGAQPLATESARIVSGETLNMSSNESIANLIVNGTLTANSPRSLDVGGDLTINSGGTVSGTGTITLSGSLSSPQNQIDGTGTFSVSNVDITTASKTIASTAVMTISGTVNIGNGLTLTNNGTVTFSGTLDGGNASSEYATGTNSTTTFSSATAPMATGTLDASATGSTVVYSNATGVTIKAPVSSYYNLETSTGTQTLGATTDVNGSFTLTSGTFAMGANDMTVAGDLTYTAGTLTSTGTITLDGSANQTVSGAWTIPNLTINNTLDGADAITVSSGITISTTLTLTDGIMGSGSNVVTVSNTATGGISGGSSASFVNGILARQTNSTSLYDFPVGEGTTFKRVGITPTATGGSTYQAEPFNTGHSDASNFNSLTITNVSTIEYWDIQRTAGTDGAQVRLYWNTRAASGIDDVTELLVGHYTGGPAQWESIGNGANSGGVDPGYVESATAVTTFSPFTFVSNSGSANPLPVELVHFEGMINGSSVLLNWSTATELNNDYFQIEKSTDGITFNIIGIVDGNGNSSQLIDYSFTDDFLTPGLSFYRLKQVDFDGAFEYSHVVSMNNETLIGFSVIPTPNPVTENNIRLQIRTDDSLPLKVKVMDMTGRVFVDEVIWFEPSHAQAEIGLSPDMKPGVYLLSVIQGPNKSHLRITVK